MNIPLKTGTIWLIAALSSLAIVALGAFVLTESAKTTPERIKAAHALLKDVRATRSVSGAQASFPPLPEVTSPQARKTLFIAAMLPIVVAENARIELQRARAEQAVPGTAAYAGLATSYGLAPDTPRERLLRRIDIVPAALVLAQGAIESAWGTSRFARDGNAFFGMRSYDKDTAGIEPREAKGFVVQSYPTPRKSVRHYMQTLNTHPAYRNFRAGRAALRVDGRRPTSLELAPYLKPYSEIGQKYVKRITLTIRANGLERYEGLRLHAP